ncbi:HAD family phosphatase [Methanocella sp. CWC-04]|uniref:HAD family phosphatase n=1 Tax=Methanooceanicella nereidis TaxID=2052831 RepID=A0AAP2W726_9EURY|nr:HAD family phosphatase [Methanocella sp. CWC-04]MCD1295963.1 HAD family phosphatase [Methanocella sp. CWC-04]
MAERCTVDLDRYKAVLFDMDGVITKTMPLHYESWKEAFGMYGVKVEKIDVYKREGETSTQMAKEISDEKNAGLSPEELDAIREEKGRLFNERASMHAEAFPGVSDTLKMLREKGVKLALVTGSRKDSLKSIMSRVGLEHSFDVIVTGDDVKNGKPNPEPFQKAMEKLGVDKSHCVVVENAPLGIKSAKAAGVDYVIAVMTSLDESYLKEADDIMPSFADLEKCLARRYEKPKRISEN